MFRTKFDEQYFDKFTAEGTPIEILQAIVQGTKKNNGLADIKLATVCFRYNELANIWSTSS